jgi:hypothetical protein
MLKMQTVTKKLTCLVCGRSKPLTHFKACRKLPDGKLPWCRDCENQHYLKTFKDKEPLRDRMFDDLKKLLEFQAVGKTVMDFNKTYFSLWLFMNPVFKEKYQEYYDDKTLTKDFRVSVESTTKSFTLRNLKLELVDLEIPFEIKVSRDWSSNEAFRRPLNL